MTPRIDVHNKGAQGEREAATVLRKLLDDPSIERILEQSRTGGHDLQGKALRHFCIEVKRVRVPRLLQWFDNMAKFCRPTRVRCVALRKDRGQWRWFVEMTDEQFSQYVRLVNSVRDGYHVE